MGITRAATALAVVAGLAFCASPASANGDDRVERDVRALLALNAGSHRVAKNVVEVGDGVRMSVPLQVNSVQGCDTHKLCLNQNKDFDGYYIEFQACRNENLGDYKMPNGRKWNDQVSSIRNAQSSGVQSRFYNYDGSGDPNDSANWNLVIVLNSGHYLADLSKDSSAEGGNANDKIDIVHVC